MGSEIRSKVNKRWSIECLLVIFSSLLTDFTCSSSITVDPSGTTVTLQTNSLLDNNGVSDRYNRTITSVSSEESLLEFHEVVTLPSANQSSTESPKRSSRVEDIVHESTLTTEDASTTDANDAFFETLNSNVSPHFRPRVPLRRRNKISPSMNSENKTLPEVQSNVSDSEIGKDKVIVTTKIPLETTTGIAETTGPMQFLDEEDTSNHSSFAEKAVSLLLSYFFESRNNTDLLSDGESSTELFYNDTDIDDEGGESRTLVSFFKNWRKSSTTKPPELEPKLSIAHDYSSKYSQHLNSYGPPMFSFPIPPPPLPLMPPHPPPEHPPPAPPPSHPPHHHPPAPPPSHHSPPPHHPLPSVKKPPARQPVSAPIPSQSRPNVAFNSKPFVGDPGIEYVFKNMDDLQRPGIPMPGGNGKDTLISADTVGFTKFPDNFFSSSSSEQFQPLSRPLPPRHPIRSEKDVPRCDRFTEEVCLDDFEYPGAAIIDEIFMKRKLFDDMYAEVVQRSDQVEGIPRHQEESYTYIHYFGRGRPENIQDGYIIEPRDYHEDGGFICPSEVVYGRPKRARNAKGEWKVVINVEQFTQTVRMERCLRRNGPCTYLMAGIYSKCSQVYSYHRFLVFEKGRNFHIDIFKIPTGCSCHIKTKRGARLPPPSLRGNVSPGSKSQSSSLIRHRNRPRYPSSSSSSSSSSSKMTFSEVLWSILSDPNSEITLSQNPQVLAKLRSHVMAIQQLKQMTPSEVLHELLEEEADYGDLMTSVSDRPAATIKHQSAELPVYKDKETGQYVEHKDSATDQSDKGNKPGSRIRNRTPRPHMHSSSSSLTTSSSTSSSTTKRRPTQKRPFSPNGRVPFLGSRFPSTPEYSVLVTDVDDIATTFRPVRKHPNTESDFQTISVISDIDGPDHEISLIELPPRIKIQNNSYQIPRPRPNGPKKKINFSYHPILEYIKPGDEIIYTEK